MDTVEKITSFPSLIRFSKNSKLRIGLTFNLKRIKPADDGSNDEEAEFDSEQTVDHIANSLASFGFEVIKLEANAQLISKLHESPVDIVFNIAEGIRGRGRESLVPALLDLLDIEYTGSDATTMAVTLDKFIAKKILSQHGIYTAKAFLMSSIKEKIPTNLQFPLFIKPVAEGSSKGINGNNVVHSLAELKERAGVYLKKYAQPLLIEEYIAGREFTVGLVGGNRPHVLPIMEIEFLNKNIEHPVYSFEYKLHFSQDVNYAIPAKLSEAQKNNLESIARQCFKYLGCRDVARIDFRMDTRGQFCFIECNALPGLTPDWSDLCLMANGAHIEYRSLIGAILTPALKRLVEKRKKLKNTSDILASTSS